MKIHLTKLQAIQQSRVENKGNAVPHKEETKQIIQELKRKRMDKHKAHEFVTHERNLAINKDNQILLSKLVEISSGKWTSVPKAKEIGLAGATSNATLIHQVSTSNLRGKSTANPQTKTVSGSGINMVRSLNLAVRKRETERIERENQAFAKRLFDKQPNFDRKELDDAYKQHLKFKKALKKVEVVRSSLDQKKQKRAHSLTRPNEGKSTNTASVVHIQEET